MEYKDYYKDLGVDKSADKDTIKKAYRKLAKKFHPDNNPGNKRAEDRFKEINEAYEVLSNDEKRKRYDTIGNQDFGPQGFDPSSFGGQYSYGGGFSSASSSDFSDFFNMFFSDLGMGADPFSAQARRPRASQQIDSQAQMSISIEDAILGKEMLVTLDDTKVNLKIPKGIRPGQKIKMKGRGQNGGDLYITIDIQNTASLYLEGDDLVKEIDIYPWQAYLGSSIQIKMPDTNLKVSIPKKFRGGSKIRLKGKGYHKKDKSRGDLYIKLNIINPSDMTEEDEKIYESLLNKYS